MGRLISVLIPIGILAVVGIGGVGSDAAAPLPELGSGITDCTPASSVITG